MPSFFILFVCHMRTVILCQIFTMHLFFQNFFRHKYLLTLSICLWKRIKMQGSKYRSIISMLKKIVGKYFTVFTVSQPWQQTLSNVFHSLELELYAFIYCIVSFLFFLLFQFCAFLFVLLLVCLFACLFIFLCDYHVIIVLLLQYHVSLFLRICTYLYSYGVAFCSISIL